jgi:hypothetical protein
MIRECDGSVRNAGDGGLILLVSRTPYLDAGRLSDFFG